MAQKTARTAKKNNNKITILFCFFMFSIEHAVLGVFAVFA